MKDNKKIDEKPNFDEVLEPAHKPAVKNHTHRLFCQACTGIAMFYTEGEELPKSVNCHACGKPQIVKRENLIKL